MYIKKAIGVSTLLRANSRSLILIVTSSFSTIVNTDKPKREFKADAQITLEVLKKKDNLLKILQSNKSNKGSSKKLKRELVIILVREKFLGVKIESDEDLSYYEKSSKKVRKYVRVLTQILNDLSQLPVSFINLNVHPDEYNKYLEDQEKMRSSNQQMNASLKAAKKLKDEALANAEETRNTNKENCGIIMQIQSVTKENLPLAIVNRVRLRYTPEAIQNSSMTRGAWENAELSRELEKLKMDLMSKYVTNKDTFNLDDHIEK